MITFRGKIPSQYIKVEIDNMNDMHFRQWYKLLLLEINEKHIAILQLQEKINKDEEEIADLENQVEWARDLLTKVG